MSERTERQRFQESFWNDKAVENAHFHIVGHMDILDESKRDETFEQLGEESGRILAPWVFPESSVLDLGCGIGRVVKRMARMAQQVTGCDVSDEMLKRGKEYLAELENCRLEKVDGASLPMIDGESVDFAYSMLALIHIDKRSAYRYYREFARILRPGGIAWLQVHDLLSEEGMRTFESVLETDYPLEFYTEEELRWMLRRVGLDTLVVNRGHAFLEAAVVKGDAAAWQQEVVDSLELRDFETEGFFADEECAPRDAGEVRCVLINKSARWNGLVAVQRLTLLGDHEDVFVHREVTLQLEPGAEIRLFLRKDEGETATRWEIEAEGRSRLVHPHGEEREWAEAGPEGITHLIGLMPAGFSRDAAGLARFQNFSWGRESRLRRD